MIISGKENDILLVPKKVMNSEIPTEYGVKAIKKEKSTNEVTRSDKKIAFEFWKLSNVTKKIQNNKIY